MTLRAWLNGLGLVLALNLLLATSAAARLYIDINTALQKKIAIAIPALRHETGATAAEAPAWGQEIADQLGQALAYTGLFRPLDPAGFLQDPQKMGTRKEEIKFGEWGFLGADLLVRGLYRLEDGRLHTVFRLFDVIAQRQLLEKSYEADTAALRTLVLRCADDIFQELTGEPGIFFSAIAFVGDASGHKEIYLADFDGANVRQLTRDRSIALSPAWDHNGARLSYVSYKRGNPDLYTVDLQTGVLQWVSRQPGPNISPAWHPKEDKLAATLTIDDNPEIYLLSGRGRVLKRLTHSWAIDVSPSWSPDGKRLAFVSNRAGKPQIYILDLASLRSSRLTFEGNYNVSPAWSPRGDRIVYAGFHDGRFDVYTISPDGEEVAQLTGGSGNNENPCWSPDGRLILFQSDRGGKPTLWVMRPDGSDQRRVPLELGGSHTEPAWSNRLTWRVP